MAAKQSERIRLWGLVQGVGFRPYVAKTAAALNMKGQVLNLGGLVEITVTDTAERISAFLHVLIENKPIPAEIVHIRRDSIPYREFNEFSIIRSETGTDTDDDAVMIPADLAVCPDCLGELYDEKSRRFQHPFISCMVCGPRYTIIDRIPYDRENTTMSDFPMCGPCMEEYTDPGDRRYHAQTISCHDCGPGLLWKTADGASVRCLSHPALPDDAALSDHPALPGDTALLDDAARILENGGVILFKSTGGYNLTADPRNDIAVSKLRCIKNREEKPFAVMFRSLEEIRRYCHTDAVEEALLSSSARPILLLERRTVSDPGFDSACQSAEFSRSRFIGAFLPGLAAQYMLLDRISPLIFTSANLSDMPMIKDDEEALLLLKKNRDISGILYNDRRIRLRADDSVVRVIDGQPQMIRRSKGYAPVPLHVNTGKSQQIFATGGQLKNSFALAKGSFVYMSQFFGDMDTVESQQIYEETLSFMADLFRIEPRAVVCDMHPLYFTTALAERYAHRHDIPLLKVQHHHAHVASVMAENHLTGKVIGVSFDGTGYGTDGCIWGSEFLLCEGGHMERIAHLRYVDMPGGDSSVRNAVKSAIGYLYAHDGSTSDASSAGAPHQITVDITDIMQYGRERILSMPDTHMVLKSLENGVNTVKSSSMGRLFDAVSALLDIRDCNSYEGQCAILLEDAAAFSQKHPGISLSCDLALSFHHRITDMILQQCLTARERYGTHQVALTGGTFQNKILMEDILLKLRSAGFKPYYNISVSPNDGGLALGQTYIAMHHL